MTSIKDRWLLPEGIEEVLPGEARAVESARRRILDLFNSWGYELVMPPLVEFLDALRTAVGKDLDLQTFKVTDQLTGRMMGIRPDMTPQAARIDAHFLKRTVPVRLCYLGPVLLTRPDEFAGSRELLQLGAELFGHAGPESDAEILNLMITTLRLAGIDAPHIDLGHVGVFRNLVAQAKLDEDQEALLFDALQRKSRPEVEGLLNGLSISDNMKRMLTALLDLSGGVEVLSEAKKRFADAPEPIRRALDYLQNIVDIVSRQQPGLSLYVDLAELSGYGYYTGAVFSAFVPGHGRAVAKGGRYDGIGKAFGRARPATGFSADLRALLKIANKNQESGGGILAPNDDDPALGKEINRLREMGKRIVQALPGIDAVAQELGCDHHLVKKGGKWIVVKLP
jgi:ATP phosphoribosyltransferase regulatory subunit